MSTSWSADGVIEMSQLYCYRWRELWLWLVVTCWRGREFGPKRAESFNGRAAKEQRRSSEGTCTVDAQSTDDGVQRCSVDRLWLRAEADGTDKMKAEGARDSPLGGEARQSLAYW